MSLQPKLSLELALELCEGVGVDPKSMQEVCEQGEQAVEQSKDVMVAMSTFRQLLVSLGFGVTLKKHQTYPILVDNFQIIRI